ncbi:MAG: pyruvate dehydrogenase (acetyl-transferring), homodimeric type, partial [Candidatus Marinimicrobia bacterium]|nr:pyruvate dehydrogenase (acetyl-transferring), homodimeric type [Candidatus Neomarinimicrobiota bacterium]
MKANQDNNSLINDSDPEETQEWIESIQDMAEDSGGDRARFILSRLIDHVESLGMPAPANITTPFINTIRKDLEAPFPGDRIIERSIKSIVRWNAMAMVVRANKKNAGLGGHISTYASAATLLEIAFNHFLRGRKHTSGGDLVYFQGHSAPGIYARAFLEGRLTKNNLDNFRRDLAKDKAGLSSYPHPWLMPEFWQFATVSMGLSPIMAIYQARFMHYLTDRNLIENKGQKIWAFLGDGEMDEPEAMGALTLASREKLDNLIFVINCNLQRLDGPVRGNSKIVQELEGAFRGAGWKVIKVLWGEPWDALFEKDENGLLQKRIEEVVDGDLLKYVVEGGAYMREHFFGKSPELLSIVEHLSDEELEKLTVGGHEPVKVYNAYASAIKSEGRPTVILARTIKGYGMGEAGEGKNITHQQKKLNEEELIHFKSRFDIPLTNAEAKKMPFYRPGNNSKEVKYINKQRKALGGAVPSRRTHGKKLTVPQVEIFSELLDGYGDRNLSTTMAFVRLLTILTKEKEFGKHVVPIIPDEARTFGVDPLFRQLGIYSHSGQKYDPVDSDQFLYYKEAIDGQILEEGITEA